MKKKLLSLIVACALLFAFTGQAALAAPEISVFIDGTRLTCEVPPVVQNGTTLVPMRTIFEALGATVNYDAATKKITSSNADHNISLTLNSTTAIKDGKNITLSVPAKSINNRTMVPLRFVSESLDRDVKWDGTNRTISITGGSSDVSTPSEPKGNAPDSVKAEIIENIYNSMDYSLYWAQDIVTAMDYLEYADYNYNQYTVQYINRSTESWKSAIEYLAEAQKLCKDYADTQIMYNKLETMIYDMVACQAANLKFTDSFYTMSMREQDRHFSEASELINKFHSSSVAVYEEMQKWE